MREGFKKVVNISGYSGLYKLLTRSNNYLVLETIDEYKNHVTKSINNTSIVLLDNITIYTNTNNGDNMVTLESVFDSLHSADKDGSINIGDPCTDAELKQIILKVLPNYDHDRLYLSNIKKIVKWYKILYNFMPDIFA